MASPNNPTPLSLARLMDALGDPAGGVVFGAAELAALRRLMRYPSLFHRLYARLLITAADAGLRSKDWDYLADAAESAEQLDRLLAARGWRDPAAVLDPEGRRDVDYAQILRILIARLGRGEGDREHLRLVARRLRMVITAEKPERASNDSLPSGPADLPARICRPGSFFASNPRGTVS